MLSDDKTGVAAHVLPLERDGFMRTLIQHLAQVLEEVVGVEEASGFISLVGRTMGQQINEMYLDAEGCGQLSREQVAEVLCDLKRRIKGDFFVIEESDTKIVLGNRQCPFGDKVKGHPSMCMMTSNVFGYIAASNLGYARVELQDTIASGSTGCRVVIHLDSSERHSLAGREYFGQ